MSVLKKVMLKNCGFHCYFFNAFRGLRLLNRMHGSIGIPMKGVVYLPGLIILLQPPIHSQMHFFLVEEIVA